MKITLILMTSIILTGCLSNPPMGSPGSGDGYNYTPVVDSRKDDLYYRDLRECRNIAYQVQTNQGSQVQSSAITGALIGAALGATEDKEAALGGALLGGLLGGYEENSNIKSNSKTVIYNCMRGRGYNVLL